MLQDKCDYFMLAYESVNFSAAAAKVPMSPQGFAKSMHNLERELGVPLFSMQEDGTRCATPYADEFYEYARHVRSERNLLMTAFDRVASNRCTELHIACSLGIPGFLGHDFLAGFIKEHTDVAISLNEMPDKLCESVLRDGFYDLALTVLPSSDEFISRPLYDSPVLYWIHQEDPLSEKSSIDIEDIGERCIAIPGDDFQCYKALVDKFEQHGAPLPQIVKYSEIFWIYEFVLHGQGIGFTLPHLANLEVFKGNSDVIAVPLQKSSWGFGVTYLKTHDLRPVEEELVEYLQERITRLSKQTMSDMSGKRESTSLYLSG